MFRTHWPCVLWLAAACVSTDLVRAQSAKDAAQTLARARQAAAQGRFSDAEALLREKIPDPRRRSLVTWPCNSRFCDARGSITP